MAERNRRRKQERDTFTGWMTDHRGILLKIVRGFTTDSADADDLAQDIALALWRSIPSFRGEAKASTWIWRIALNQAISWQRSVGERPSELREAMNADGVALTEPRDLDVEWFATAGDLCRTLVHLAEVAEQPGLEPVAEILEINAGQGIPFDRERWPVVRFKGGSEPGVLAGAWWFEGDDGSRHVVVGGVANPDAALPELDVVLTLASAIELVR